MRLTRINQIHQLSFLPRSFPVNCYLVEEQDDLTLIDAALPYSAKAILASAEKIGKPISRIVLTHAHDDHIGALDKLKESLPHAEVYISKRDERLLRGDVSLDDHEPQTPIRGGVPKNIQTRADVLLEENDVVGSLRTISAPGHTPGSMAFFDQRDGSLIVGDAFQTRGGTAVSGQLNPLFPFPALATWNKEVALKSAQKLVSLKPTLLAAGHGVMIPSPESIMNKAILKAKKKG
jgi:glyoxylase-like metal-dependent hydrolase (beta-lactamase superfamily II)